MSLFAIPKGIIDEINKIQRRFLWCGHTDTNPIAPVAWEMIQLPKSLGGLSVGNLLHKNLALLFKWVWRYLHEPDALWRRIVQEKYKLPQHFNTQNIITPLKGGPWKNICNAITKNKDAMQLASTGTKKRVGNGRQTYFWYDLWITDLPLNAIFPRLFSIATNQLATIASLGFWDGCTWVWNFSWNRVLRPRDIEERNSLHHLLEKAYLSLHNNDKHVWTPHYLGSFSVKSFCFELAKKSSSSQHDAVKGLWKGLVPHKIEIFTWMALLGKLNTREKLVKIGILPSNEALCPLCFSYPESCNHLLLHCSMARQLWFWWLGIWNLQWVFPLSLRDAFDQWNFSTKGKFCKKIWFASFFVIVWTVWKERNARIFNNTSSSIKQLQELVLLRLSWWLKGWNDKFPYSANEVLRNPQCLFWDEGARTSCSFGPTALWSPPQSTSIKWNVDASVDPRKNLSAIGGILRNPRGDFVCLFSCPIPPIEINSAEIIAIYRAIQISLNSEQIKYMAILIESDSANAVSWCNEGKGGPWNLSFQLNFIRNARKNWLNINIVHKKRSSNVVADSLAKKGLARESEFLAWL
ncbi:uncharacterized protein LOC125492022 [Beta vulgaris subsp. vulgaris]|uniref:uncharacterized protein LOC125492022 n=1 Tax=Beta vulgaris subsp. vulgaris TaxID=3555 RepID=UPI00203727C7|nr:uncharacterized protein LOC125492022 [Beta vulgaris subsp. vulgaris]